MNDTAKNKLRKGLDLFWEVFRQKNQNHSNEAKELLEKIGATLNRAEGLYTVDQIKESAKAAMKAGNILGTFDIRCGIALWRKANLMQLQSGTTEMKTRSKQFADRATKMLDHAEALLDEDKVDEAKVLCGQYFREKVRVGLAGPFFKTPPQRLKTPFRNFPEGLFFRKKIHYNKNSMVPIV